MNDLDMNPFVLIKAGDPAPPDRVPGPDSELGRTIKARVLASPPPSVRPRSNRVWLRAVAVAGTVVALVAAGWALSQRASDPQGVACYEAPAVDADRVVVMTPAQLAAAECAPLWLDGTLANPAIVAAAKVPPLVGCVSTEGVLWVFPSDDQGLCSALDLAGAEPVPGNDPDVELNRRLVSLFGDRRCMSMADARATVEDLLAEMGASDWDVVVTAPGGAARPCASFSLDAAARAISLVPVPPPPDE